MPGVGGAAEWSPHTPRVRLERGASGGKWRGVRCGRLGTPLCCDRLGCGLLDYRQQAQQIELKTGGMSVSPYVLPDDSHLDTFEQVAVPSASRGAPWRCSSTFFCPFN